MKKKMLFVLTTIVAFALFVPSVMAASTPELVEISGKKIFLANGVAITIEAPAGGEGALIKWEGGEKAVPASVTVFGGMHNDDTKVNTSITMNGGTVKNIMAGGLHKSSVGTATVVINGGNVTGSLMGGSYAGFVNDADFSTSTHNPTYSATDQSNLTIRVEKTYMEINGGDVNNIFGGGGGHNYVGETEIYVSASYEGTTDYLVSGGSHGYTGKATVTLNGGSFDVVQSVNRGFMDSSTTLIDGASVENAYVGGEPYTDPTSPGNSVTGVIASAEMNVVSGEVENLSVGTSGGEQFPATDVAKVVYNEDVVKNIDTDEFDEENITTTVTVTMVAIIDGEEGTEETILPKGYVLTEEEIEELESLEEYFNEYFEEEGLDYVFKGFYLDKDGKEEVDFAEALDEDITWYILFEEKAEELPPKTGDLNLVLLIGTILVGIAGVAVVSKKRFAKGN